LATEAAIHDWHLSRWCICMVIRILEVSNDAVYVGYARIGSQTQTQTSSVHPYSRGVSAEKYRFVFNPCIIHWLCFIWCYITIDIRYYII